MKPKVCQKAEILLNSEKIKPVIFKLCLSEGISQVVRQAGKIH